jgi:hypothetical protein
MYCSEPAEFITLTLEEAKAICWHYCQCDSDDKTKCFNVECPLAKHEIENRRNLIEENQRLIDEQNKRLRAIMFGLAAVM